MRVARYFFFSNFRLLIFVVCSVGGSSVQGDNVMVRGSIDVAGAARTVLGMVKVGSSE